MRQGSTNDLRDAMLRLEPEAAHKWAEFVQAVEIFSVGVEAAIRAFAKNAARSAAAFDAMVRWLEENPTPVEISLEGLDNNVARL